MIGPAPEGPVLICIASSNCGKAAASLGLRLVWLGGPGWVYHPRLTDAGGSHRMVLAGAKFPLTQQFPGFISVLDTWS